MFTTKEIRKIMETGDPEKIALIPKEDLEIFQENEDQREMFSKNGIKNLYKAICEKAVVDYKALHKITMFKCGNSKAAKTREEQNLEAFFGSEFFLDVTGLRSKEHVIESIEKTMIDERKKKAQMALL